MLPKEYSINHSSYHTFIKQNPQLGQRVYIAPQATVIGATRLGDDVSVWPSAVIRGDMHTITIGSRSNIQDGAILHITHASDYNPTGFPLEIGEDVTIGHGAILHGCHIHDRVLIGMGAIIMDGVTIESNTIIGAGCIVTPGKTLTGGFLYYGNPIKQARSLSEEEKSFLLYSANNYIKLKNNYLEI